jgi:voltage-gated potassium channel
MYHVQGTHVVPGMNAEQRRKARRWEAPAMVVALAVIPYLLLSYYTSGPLVHALGVVIWTFFAVEALRMLSLAPENLEWVRRNVLDIVIIVLTVPVGIFFEELQVLRVLWLLRILDLLPLVHRYVFRITVVRFAFILWVLTVFGGGIAFATLQAGTRQGPTLLEAFYWANTTISTVGYGDVLPTTEASILLTMPLQAMGVVLGAILVAGVLPLFDKNFAEGFAARVSEKVEQLAGDVSEIEEDVGDIEQDIDEIARGEAAQDRVLALIARDLEDMKAALLPRAEETTDGAPQDRSATEGYAKKDSARSETSSGRSSGRK